MPRKLIVVAGYINHTTPFARFAQEFLNHVVMCLGPIPAAAQLPAIDDVTHQVQVIAGVFFEKVQQSIGLAPRCTQVQV